jgi:HK97 family phage prohead protease
MPEHEIERRYVPSVVEPIELEERSAASPTIKGISPPFNSKSEDLGNFREVFSPTAFDKIVGRHRNDPRGGMDVVALFDHEGQPIGRTVNDTLKLAISERGLAYSISPPDTTLGRDIVTLVRRGDLYGASFAFSVAPGGESWTQEADGSAVRTISEVGNLYDVSVVTRPAYPQSSAALRSLEAWRAENLTSHELEQLVEQQADAEADKRRRWSYALTAAAARLVSARLKVNAPRIK